MTVYNQPMYRAGHYLVSEAEGYRSRDAGVIASGAGVLLAGTVLSRTAASLEASSAAIADVTGDGTFVLDATTPILAAGKVGVYTLRFTSVTNIRLEDPDGVVLADIPIVEAAAEVANVNEQIKGVVTQGATTFAVGDGFDITVALAATVKHEPYDGSRPAAAILFEGCDATSADIKRTLTTRDCEVHAAVLQWADGVTDQQKTAGLADLTALGMIGR